MGAADSQQRLTERIKEATQSLEIQIKKETERINKMKTANKNLPKLLLSNLSYSIESRSDFSDDTLIGAYIADKKQCEQILIKSFEEILKPPIDKTAYLWFKKSILSSPILLLNDSSSNEYLYEKLLKIATNYAVKTQSEMNQIFSTIQSDKSEWNELQNIKNESRIERQDNIGLLNNKELYDINSMESKENENSMDDVAEFIDIHIGINELMAVATNLNHEFQEYISNVMKDLGEFHDGPLKTYQRCQAKVQNDYQDAEFPHCAKLLDIIRCSLTFDNLSKMLMGYKYFINFCKKNPNKLDIARIKNGFLTSAENHGGYRDIKVNVVYYSLKHKKKMISEVQFILRSFLNFKKKAHKLYSINRQQIYFEMASNAYYGITNNNENANEHKNSIETIYEAVNFERADGTTPGEVHCCINSKYGLVASCNGTTHKCIITDFKNKRLCANGTFDGVHRRVRMIGKNESSFAVSSGEMYLDLGILESGEIEIVQCDEFDLNKKGKPKQHVIAIGSGNEAVYNFNSNENGTKLVVLAGTRDSSRKMVISTVQQETDGKWPNKSDNSTIQFPTTLSVTNTTKLSVSPDGNYASIAMGWAKKYFLHISINKNENDQKKRIQKFAIKDCKHSMASCYYKNDKNETFLICAACKSKSPNQIVINIWNVKDSPMSAPKKEIFLSEKDGTIRCIISDGSILIGACGVPRKFAKIKVWDLRSWKLIYDEQISMNIVNYLDMSQDGKYLAISGNGEKTLIVLKLKE